MMGGFDVKTAEHVRIYSAMLKEPVAIGQHVEEPTCVAEDHPMWQAALAAGRECPRVDLDEDNQTPYRLLLMAASDHTRSLFDHWFTASCGHLPAEEREAVLDRVFAGLMSQPVIEKLFPKPAEKK